MRKFILALGAAAILAAAPAFVQPASAETDVNIRVGSPAYKSRAQTVVVKTKKPVCRTVTTKIKRAGRTVVTKKRVCR